MIPYAAFFLGLAGGALITYILMRIREPGHREIADLRRQLELADMESNAWRNTAEAFDTRITALFGEPEIPGDIPKKPVNRLHPEDN